MPAERLAGLPARAWRSFEGFVFAAEDPRRLAALRIGLFGLLAVRLASTDYAFVADQPPALFDPLSLFHLLEAMPSSELVSVLQPLAVAAALAAAAGLVPRLSFPLAFGLALFLNLMLNSTGKVMHDDVLMTLCLLPLLATPRVASAAWSLGRRAAPARRPAAAYGWPVRTAMIVVAVAYLFAGLQKLRFSGIEWVTEENLRWVLYAASDAAAEPNQLALWIADRPVLTQVMAGGALAVEIAFILCLPLSRLRPLMVGSVVALHLGIWLTMGLNYLPQALVVLIVFANWARLAEIPGARRSRAAPA